MSVALLLAACTESNVLGGSVDEVFPLDVSRVEVAANGEALQVTYFYNRGVFLDVVARVSVSLRDITLKPGVTIPLQGMTGDGSATLADGSPAPEPVLRCAVTHAPGGEPVRNLPPVVRGDMVIHEGGVAGGVTRGDFSVLFANEGGDLGHGRTLYGDFIGETADAGFGELP